MKLTGGRCCVLFNLDLGVVRLRLGLTQITEMLTELIYHLEGKVIQNKVRTKRLQQVSHPQERNILKGSEGGILLPSHKAWIWG